MVQQSVLGLRIRRQMGDHSVGLPGVWLGWRKQEPFDVVFRASEGRGSNSCLKYHLVTADLVPLPREFDSIPTQRVHLCYYFTTSISAYRPLKPLMELQSIRISSGSARRKCIFLVNSIGPFSVPPFDFL